MFSGIIAFIFVMWKSLHTCPAGSGNINITSGFKDIQLLLLSGSGNINLNGDCILNKLEANIVGSGNINATGNSTVQNLTTRISGSGNIHLSQLKAKVADCSISGSGRMNVFIEDTLEASVSGSGDIEYEGTPRVDSHVSGSGNVYKNWKVDFRLGKRAYLC